MAAVMEANGRMGAATKKLIEDIAYEHELNHPHIAQAHHRRFATDLLRQVSVSLQCGNAIAQLDGLSTVHWNRGLTWTRTPPPPRPPPPPP